MRSICDATSVCGLANATVSGVLAPQLEELGFTPDSSDCGTCISKCEEVFGGEDAHSSDDEVLECLATNAPQAAHSAVPELMGSIPTWT